MKNKPSVITSLMWGTFAGTATASAFLLPLFFAAFLLVPNFLTKHELLTELFITFVFFFGWYHAWYRIKALAHDLDLGKFIKIIEYISYIMIGLGSIITFIHLLEIITSQR